MNSDPGFEQPPDFKQALDELERLITNRVVAGEPITLGDHTVIPLMSVGFGYGAGRGSGSGSGKGGELGLQSENGKGDGLAVGFGGGVRPVAAIIQGPDGVTVQPLVSEKASTFAAIAQAIASKTSTAKPSEDDAQ